MTYVDSAYARSHSGLNYQAKCPKCGWAGGSYPDNGMGHIQARNEGERHVCETP